MLIALWLYSAIGCMSAGFCMGWHGRSDCCREDRIETAIGALWLLVAWPVFSVLWAWRAWR